MLPAALRRAGSRQGSGPAPSCQQPSVTPSTAKPRAVEEGRCYNNTPQCLPGVEGDEMLPSPGWGFPNGVKGAACALVLVAGRWQLAGEGNN